MDILEAQLDDEIAGLDTTPDTDNDNDNQQTDSVDHDTTDTDNEENSTVNDNAPDDVSVDDAAHTDNKNEEDVTNKTNNYTPTVVGGHALRSHCTGNYQHLKGQDGDGLLPTVARPDEFGHGVRRHDSHLIMQNVVMSQYSMKQGVKKFSNKRKQSVLNELHQLHDQDVGEPVDKNTMGNDEIKCTLR